jgi:uncharacterized membrane protein
MKDKSTSLPPAEAPQAQIVQMLIAAQSSGPLPPPDMLARYEEILPGAAERIISLAEQELMHRRDLEERYSGTIVGNSRMGLIFGFLIGIGGLVVATMIGIYGNPEAGVGMGLVTLGSLVGIFIYGSRVTLRGQFDQHERQ